MKKAQVEELVYQALETELGGVQVYRTAIRCAQNPDLKEEWEKYLEETENHVRVMRERLREARPGHGEGDPGAAGRPPQGPGAGRRPWRWR